MKASNKSLKALAREHLHGNYGVLIGTFFILYIISLASTQIISFSVNISTITGIIIYNIAIILFQLIFMIFTVGCAKQSLDIASGGKAQINTMFYGFKHHPNKSICISFLVGLYVIGIMLLFIICAGFLTGILAFLNSGKDLFSTPIIICYFVVMYILLLVVIYAASLRYSLVYFLLADYEEYGSIQIMKLSASLMDGNKLRVFGLCCSFIGMFFLGMLSCGIGFLWIQPYMQVTMAQFYLAVTTEKSPTQSVQSTYDTYEVPEIPEVLETPESEVTAEPLETTETTY